jgi:carboxyl-terminal processing protease
VIARRRVRRLVWSLGAALLMGGLPGVSAKPPTQEESDRAVRIFLNVKEQIVHDCIYRPDDRKVVVDALKELAVRLGPEFAGYFPADLGSTLREALESYQATLRRLCAARGLEKRTMQELAELSLRAFCQALDRYSDYDDRAAWQREKPVKRMDYIGVGMTFERTREGFECYPLPGGPASFAGARAADRLLEVDGVSARGLNLADLTPMILGKEGTQVTLKVQRGVPPKVEMLTIKREPITSSFLEVSQAPGEATVRLRRLTDATVNDLREFLGTVPRKSRLTLDLRGCHGGELFAAVHIAELFLPAGAIIGRVETLANTETFRSSNPTPFRPASLLILQDRGTASGAEMIIVALFSAPDLAVESRGERSYGKGVTLTEVEIPGGAGRLRITDGRITGPHGEFWDGEGLPPSVESEPPAK